MRRIMASRLTSRCLLGLGSCLFMLSLLECAALLNIVDYRTLLGGTRWEALSKNDSELLYVHRPYAHSTGMTRGGDAGMYYRLPLSDLTLFRWNVQYDRNGFRNDLDLESADTVVVGDSFVEDIPTPLPQLMTSLLAQARGETVANLGQIAYGPQQELVVLKRYGLPLKPRTVVWMFFEGNDLTDVIHYRAAIASQNNPWSSFVRRSFTVAAAKLVKRRLFARDEKSPGIKRSGFVEGASSPTAVYFVNSGAPLNADDLGALAETSKIVAVANNLCTAQGARFVFVFIPEKFRVFRDLCSFPEASECRHWVLNDLPARMRQAITAMAPDLGYIDLTTNLKSAAQRGQLPYYPDDAHWTPAGHRVAAETINRYLSQ